MNYSNKQNEWANDIKLRITIMLNGFIEKCSKTEEDYQFIERVEKMLENENSNFFIDEYKGVTNDSVVKMFDFSDEKFCKCFKMLLSSKAYLHEFKQQQREEQDRKWKEIECKYGNNSI